MSSVNKSTKSVPGFTVKPRPARRFFRLRVWSRIGDVVGLLTSSVAQLCNALEDLVPEAIRRDTDLLQVFVSHFGQNLKRYLFTLKHINQMVELEATNNWNMRIIEINNNRQSVPFFRTSSISWPPSKRRPHRQPAAHLERHPYAIQRPAADSCTNGSVFA